jgi:hypothetical protein
MLKLHPCFVVIERRWARTSFIARKSLLLVCYELCYVSRNRSLRNRKNMSAQSYMVLSHADMLTRWRCKNPGVGEISSRSDESEVSGLGLM